MAKSTNKVKRIEKNNMTFLEIKSIKGQQLDLTQVEAITKGKIEGLIPLTIKDGHSFTMIYNITGMSSLNEYLQSTQMNKQHFGFLLQNIFDVCKNLEAHFFHQSNLLLSMNRVKVDPASKRLYFVYLPLQRYDNEMSLKEFLLEILNVASFGEEEDLTYVQDYIRILNTGVNFSIFELEQYINSLTNRGVVTQQKKKCPNCGHMVSADANFCTNCRYSYISKGVTGQMGGGTTVYDPLNDNAYVPNSDPNDDFWNLSDPEPVPDHEPEPIPDPEPQPIEDYGQESTTGMTQETGGEIENYDDLDDDDIATTVLSAEKIIVKKGYLTRISTQEKVEIKPGQCSVGRGTTNYYIVSGNTAIGRQHAVITNQEERFFIIDLNSTNKTYVNDEVIMPRQNVEIFDDTKIRLANEEFIFNIVVTEE